MLKTYAVIGDPIEHSLSPTIHNAAYRELGRECTYIAYRVAKGDLASGIESLKKIKIAGFNVTIPHKIEMMNYLDDVDENCKKIGAVNTVLNDDAFTIKSKSGSNESMSSIVFEDAFNPNSFENSANLSPIFFVLLTIVTSIAFSF